MSSFFSPPECGSRAKGLSRPMTFGNVKKQPGVILSGAKDLRGLLRFNDSQPTAEIRRYALSKVCHSERSEESALFPYGLELGILREVYPGAKELQILRFAQNHKRRALDDSDFHPPKWATGPYPLRMALSESLRVGATFKAGRLPSKHHVEEPRCARKARPHRMQRLTLRSGTA